MSSKNKIKFMQSTQESRKTFNYAIGKVALNFTLRSDVKEEMRDFLECLKTAQKDVQEEINKLN